MSNDRPQGIDQLKRQSISRRQATLRDIIRVRNRKLALLYCVYNFPYKPLRNSDADKLSPHLQNFLNENSIGKISAFTEASLIQDKKAIELLSNTEKKETIAKDVALENKSVVTKLAEPRLAINESVNSPISSTNKTSAIEKSLPVVTKPPTPSSLGNFKSFAKPVNTQTEDKIQGKRKLEEEKEENNIVQKEVIKKRKIPAPAEESSFEFSKLLQSQDLIDRESKSLVTNSIIKPENEDQALYMLLNENLPTKISKTMPLAKLFYYSRSLQMVKLLANSHKVLTTDLFEGAFLEGKVSVVHSRIEELQKQGKWCLKQPRRFMDPFKQQPVAGKNSIKNYWDNLIQEAIWMATDFKEAKKYKQAMCLFISTAVMDYWTYGKENCCIKTKPIKFLEPKEITEENNEQSKKKEEEEEEEEKGGEEEEEEEEEEDFEMKFEEEFISNEILGIESPKNDQSETINTELLIINNDNNEKLHEENVKDPLPLITTIKPKANYPKHNSTFPFRLTLEEETLGGIDKSVFDSLKEYNAFQNINNVDPNAALYGDIPGNEFTTNSIVPVSKLLIPTEDDQNWFKIVEKIQPEKEDIFENGGSESVKGLFATGSAYIRRFNTIKPPMPPPIKYLDMRTPTIWLPEDDRRLLAYCNRYSFNWNIISCQLSAKTTKSYTSNIERRTPWQCFERYIQLSDKFQLSDMRGPYAQAAQVWLEASYKAQNTTKRRILPLGVGKESIQRGHTKLRWASMFEAMKLVMKKREKAPKPGSANSFKKQMSAEDKSKIMTPTYLSAMKSERERASREINLARSRSAKTPSQGSGPQVNKSVSETSQSSTPQPNTGRVEKMYDPKTLVSQTQSQPQPLTQTQPQPQQSTQQIQPQPSLIKKNDPKVVTGNPNSNVTTKKVTTIANVPIVSQTNNDKIPISAPNSINRPNALIKPQLDIHSQASAIISQIQAKNPTWSNEEVTKAAAAHIAMLQNRRNTLQTSNNNNNNNIINNNNNRVPSKVVGSNPSIPSPIVSNNSNNISPTIANNFLAGRLNLNTLTPQQRNQLMLQMLQRQQQQAAMIGNKVNPNIANSLPKNDQVNSLERQKQFEQLFLNSKNAQDKADQKRQGK